MQKETELFFEDILREDRSVLDFSTPTSPSSTTGSPGTTGSTASMAREFRKVKRPPNRGGLLTQASILTLTSNPTRTSPVKRGKWVLEQLLGTPPPPPPPDVPDCDERKALTGTLRQRMEQHRANPICASCHARMDPLGFAFENFDAIGAWREKDGNFPIDPSGELPDGQKFDGPAELKMILKEKGVVCQLAERRKCSRMPSAAAWSITTNAPSMRSSAALEKNDYRISALITETSRANRSRCEPQTGEKQ